MTIRIKGKTIEIPDDERQECEVWTRVMGYFRPVDSFNIGKQSEHRERKFYSVNRVSDCGRP